MEGEDAGSIKQHMKVIQDEMHKVAPNLKTLKDHWMRTYDHRRKLLSNENTSTQDAIKTFPALTNQRIVS